MVPENRLHLYYIKGRVGNELNAEERLEERENIDDAVKEFARLFKELTGNEFEPWEREKKFEKKPMMFYPIDMDDGVDARYGGLALRKLGIVAAHSQLELLVANFIKVLCCQQIYKYALIEMALDSPELPMGMLSDFHLKKCEEVLLQFIEIVKSAETEQKAIITWWDFRQKWFTLLPSTRPFNFTNYKEDADHSYTLSVDHIYAVEPSACPSYNEIKKLPNKVLWCGTRNSNLLRHLHKGFLPAICSLPVPGYMFGKAIVCSDAEAEAARYGFTAIGKSEGFLVLAVVSLGDQITEITSPPEDTKLLEEKKIEVKALGKKKPDESEHFIWKDSIKVPCGPLVPSWHNDSPLEYNQYAMYNPKQVSIRFVVEVKYEEKGFKRKVIR